MHLIVKCQFIIPGHHFGGGGRFLLDKLNVSNDVRILSGQTRRLSGLFPAGGLHMFFTESLILAQDERWRRA